MIEEKRIDSLAKYLDLVEAKSLEWGQPKEQYSKADPWYRGQLNACSRYELKPGYLRLKKCVQGLVSENALREEFQRRSLPLLERQIPSRGDTWSWYFLMQHYEMPTRLLDWSESSLVGLYFAVADYKGCGKHDKADGAVWMLDPSFLNEITTGGDEVFPYDDVRAARHLRADFSADGDTLPLAILPIHNSRRIQAQRGMFTIHGSDQRPLEAILCTRQSPRFLKIIVDGQKKNDIRRALTEAGFSHSVVFPEVPFLSLEIREVWGLLSTNNSNCCTDENGEEVTA